jgi:hypothetical protein
MNQMSKASLRECVTFTNVDATHWQVNYNGGASHDVITERRIDRSERFRVRVTPNR